MDISITEYMIVFTENRCPHVPHLSNGVASTGITDHGTNVSFTCAPGHHFSDNKTVHYLTCSKQSQWIGNSIPSCIGKIWLDFQSESTVSESLLKLLLKIAVLYLRYH